MPRKTASLVISLSQSPNGATVFSAPFDILLGSAMVYVVLLLGTRVFKLNVSSW